MAFAEAKSGGAIVACGYSYGAASGVSAARENPCVKALLLVAPPVLMLNVDALKSFPGRILLVAGDRDEYAPRRELEALATELNAAEFVLLEGTDHYFTRGLEELGRAAERFFRQIASVR